MKKELDNYERSTIMNTQQHTTKEGFKMEDSAILTLVDGVHGLNSIVKLLSDYKPLLRIVESPRGDKLQLEDESHLDEVIEDGDLYLKWQGGYWLVEYLHGDIVAVNPESTWCEHRENYRLIPENVFVYHVGSHFLPAFMYSDMTGLSEHDIEAFERFCSVEKPVDSESYWSYDDCPSTEVCGITGLLSHCTELHLVKKD